MSITNITGNAVLNKLFGNTSLTQPATYYFGLSTTTPLQDGTGYTEPVGNGYLRVSVANSDKTNWTTSTLSTLSNVNSITFPESTGSWGTITYVLIFDASSGGNLWYFGALSPSISVATNTTVYFASSGVTISMTNS